MAGQVGESDVLRAYIRAALERIPYESGNYPYVTARVKAKKAALYPPETYPRLLQMEIPQIARFLGEGAYKDEIVALGTKLRGVDLIERATADNLAKVFRQVIAMCEGGLREMVARYLDRWDVANIKTILRGRLYGAPPAEILEDLVPAGSFDAAFLQELVEKETIDEVFAALEGSIYEDALRQIGETFDPAKGFAAYEDALSHVFYRTLLESIQPRTEPSRLFLEFVRAEIDILNLKTLLRAWKAKARFEHPVFLDGGFELTPEALGDIVGLDLNGLLAALAKTSFYRDIAPVLQEIQTRGASSVERALEKLHLKAASRYSHLHPLSVLPVLDFLALKVREVENIRIIARGKEHGLPPEAIKELLVI